MLKNSRFVYGDRELDVPYHQNFGKDIFDSIMKNKHLDAIINAETDERMTYLSFAQHAANVAVSLTRAGVGRGDVVSICSEKRLEVLPTTVGIMCTGATFSPADITYGTQTLLHRVKLARPKVMFCSASAYDMHEEALRTVLSIETFIVYGEARGGALQFEQFCQEVPLEQFRPVAVDGSDVVLILFSSGTTGLPKGVPMTHLGFMMGCRSIITDSSKGNSVLSTREWYFTFGLTYTLASLRAGCTVVYCPKNTESEHSEAIQKYKIKSLQLVPSQVADFVKSSNLDNYDVTSVETIISASSTMKAELIQAFKKRFAGLKKVMQIYGMTEAGSICNELVTLPRPGSVGLACPGFVMKVVDIDTGELLGSNKTGEIRLQSPTLTPGYIGGEAEANHLDEEGFFKTGDVGFYDDDGYFYIVDRIKELIKFNDIHVAPAEFESLLLGHGAVRAAAVVGVPHPEHGQAPVACVVLQPGAAPSEKDLIEHVNSQMTYRTRLTGVMFVHSIPMTAGGKPDRKGALKLVLDSNSKI